jgi:hypothetical protein
LLQFFKRCNSWCKNGSPDLQKFAAYTTENFVSVKVFLKGHAAPRIQMVSMQQIDAHQVQKVLRQQPWLVGRCKTWTSLVSYADTHCACISMTDKEHSALLRRIQILRACSCKFLQIRRSHFTSRVLHRECPHIKSRCFLTDDFKNLKSICVPLFGPNLWYKEIISTTFSWECPINLQISYGLPNMRASKDLDNPAASVLNPRRLSCRLCMNFTDFPPARRIIIEMSLLWKLSPLVIISIRTLGLASNISVKNVRSLTCR